MKKLSKLLSLFLALNFFVPAYASASSEGQDEMKKIGEKPELYYKDLYPLTCTDEFFEPTNSSLCSEAIDGNEEAIIRYAQIMRIGYETASYHKDQKSQTWYVKKIRAICQVFEKKYCLNHALKFLYAFSFNPIYSNPITCERGYYKLCLESSGRNLIIELSFKDGLYKIEFEELCNTIVK